MNKTRTIVKVYRISANQLQGIRKCGTDSVSVPTSVPFQDIDIRVPARLTLSDSIVDGVRIYTAQLVFRTCEDTGDHERVVYACETANGDSYLIGTAGRPYPVTTVHQTLPDNMTDSQLEEVTVNYSSAKKIPLIE